MCCLFISWSWVIIFLLLFHIFVHFSLIYVLMIAFRVDFRFDFVDFVLFFFFIIVVSFVFIFAISFPSISMWPGIHIINMFNVLSCLISFTSFRIFCMIVCPDCLPGFLVALITAWLFVKNMYLIYYWYCLAIWMIISITINSIMNILFYDSCFRYYCLISLVVELYVVAFILLSISDSFVYMHIISESIVSSKRMISWYALISSLIGLM